MKSLTRKSGWHYWGFQFHFQIPYDLLNIDSIYFERLVDRIDPAELQLNKANSTDTKAPFFVFKFINI